MKMVHPLIYHCPEDLQGDQKYIMNVLANGVAGNLGPFTITQIMIYSDFDRQRVINTIQALADKNLVQIINFESKKNNTSHTYE